MKAESQNTEYRMAAPCESSNVDAVTRESELFCNIEATVVTGFEEIAKGEVEEKCGIVTKVSRGKINIKLPVEKAKQVLELQSVDHCKVIMTQVPHFGFTDSQHDNLLRLRKLVGEVDWPQGLRVWRKFFSFDLPVSDVPDTITDDFGEVTEPVPRQRKGEGKKSKKSKKKKKVKGKESGGKTEPEVNAADEADNVMQADAETKCDNSDTLEGEVATSVAGNKLAENVAIEKDSEKNMLAENVANNQESKEEEINDINCSNKETDGKVVKNGDNDEPKKPRTRINPWDPTKPAFRVTCNRNGDKHNFDSMTAAANFGGAVYRYFGWNVEMTKFNIEVTLNIEDEEVTVGIGLTRESLHRRNIDHFGPTTLRPTICYNMLRLCEIQPGDVVCDPMCGSGSISVQSSVSWPESYNIAGDIAKKCIWRTRDNLQYMNEERGKLNKTPLEVDVLKWDACNLPLRDQCVDVFITDLPFGLRVGSRLDNWRLYRCALEEMARVVRPGTGRVCLLTQDKKCMIKTLMACSRYWNRTQTLGINIGGLAAGVFVLLRTRYQLETSPTQETETSAALGTSPHSETQTEQCDTKT